MSDYYGYYYAPIPIGMITVGVRSNGAIFFCRRGKYCETLLWGSNKTWLDNYFAGKGSTYDGILELPGTPFQRSVWFNLFSIPYGNKVTYAHMANLIGSPRAYRAVGSACAANPCPLFVPCHRVIGTANQGGYIWGNECKQFLLGLETKNRVIGESVK